MPSKHRPRPAAKIKAEVVVNTPTHKFLATIDGKSINEQGQVVGSNGIRWTV